MNYGKRIERLEEAGKRELKHSYPAILRPQFTQPEWLEMVRLYHFERSMSQTEAMRAVLSARADGIAPSEEAYINKLEDSWRQV